MTNARKPRSHPDGSNDFALEPSALFRLGERMRLVRPSGNAMPLAFAIVLPYWLVLVGLGVMAGREPFDMAYLDIHVRLLVALPLLFAFESVFPARVVRFASGIATGGQLDPAQAEALRRTFITLGRWRRSVWPELACLVLAILAAFAFPTAKVPGMADATPGIESLTGIHAAWQFVGMTLFRFLLLRCLLLVMLWYCVLWRLSRLRMELNASHADGVSGLAGLEVVHAQFNALMFASASVLSASVAIDLSLGRMQLPDIFPILVALVAIHALLFLAPLLMITPTLWRSRLRGLGNFNVLAETYARRFERKWIDARGDGDEILGNADFSGFIDLNSVAQGVRSTKVFPVSYWMLTVMLGATLVPMVPLLLFKYPGLELLKELVKRVAGL